MRPVPTNILVQFEMLETIEGFLIVFPAVFTLLLSAIFSIPSWFQSRAALQDSYLVAKGQNLNLQRGASAKPGADTNDHGKESSRHAGTLAQSSLSSMISV